MRARNNGFTLIEALIALSLLWFGMAILMDGWTAHNRSRFRLERETGSVDDLARLSETLSVDAARATSAQLQSPSEVQIVKAGGARITYRATPTGLVREESGARTRFRGLLAARFFVDQAGGASVLVTEADAGPGHPFTLVRKLGAHAPDGRGR